MPKEIINRNSKSKLKSETNDQYNHRLKYLDWQLDKERREGYLNSMYYNMKDSQDNDKNIVSSTIRKVITSPLHLARNIANEIDVRNLNKNRTTQQNIQDKSNLISSAFDNAALINPFDLGVKAKSLTSQVASRVGKETIEDYLINKSTDTAKNISKNLFAYGGEINNNINNNIMSDPIKKNNQPATRRDSLNLQKNYLLKEKQLEALGYKRQSSETGSYPEAHSLMMKNYNDVKNKEVSGIKTQIIQPKGYRLPGIYPSNIYREDKVNNNENLYKSQEAGDIGVLNPQVPYSFYDKRISPTKKDLWVNPAYNDGVVNYGYDFGEDYAPKPVTQNNSNIKRVVNHNVKPVNNKIAFTTPASRMAYGGNLNDNMENKNLTEFNEGGSHEENPLGGVPLGENASFTNAVMLPVGSTYGR